jgi:hypothetical protein
MNDLKVFGSAVAEFDDRAQTQRTSNDVAGTPEIQCDVTVAVSFHGVGQLTDAAIDAVHRVLRREAERIAQIAAVDERDSVVAKHDAEFIRSLPKDRPHIIVSPGTKDPNFVQVVRGTWEVGSGKHKRTLSPENRS